MNDGGEEFRIRPGRIRSTRIGKPKSFVNQVLRAAKKAGHTATQPGAARHPSGFGRSTFGRGRIAFSRNRLFSPQRRVVVKARIARHQGRAFRSAAMSAHLSYLKRDGVTARRREGAHVRYRGGPCRRCRLCRTMQGRPASLPFHRLARGR